MREASQFTRERAIYWPGEFSDVVGLLTGKDSSGNFIAQPIYQFNTGAIILAASLGVKNMRKREVGADRKEITTTTFSSQGLERYIFLIAMLGDPDGCVGLLRPENEETVIREFEKFAAGGLEFLRSEFEDSPTQSCDLILHRLLLRAQDADSVDGDELTII